MRIWENLKGHLSHKGFLGRIELAVGTNRSGMFWIGQKSGMGLCYGIREFARCRLAIFKFWIFHRGQRRYASAFLSACLDGRLLGQEKLRLIRSQWFDIKKWVQILLHWPFPAVWECSGVPYSRNQGQLPHRLNEDIARIAKRLGWLNKFGEQILRMRESSSFFPFIRISWTKCGITHRGARACWNFVIPWYIFSKGLEILESIKSSFILPKLCANRVMIFVGQEQI